MDAKRTSSHFSADRISNLPRDVKDNIFKYLPFRDAVRTSILSKGWQYKYLTTPYLVFDRKFAQKLPKDYNVELIISQILLLHKEPIVKFTYEKHVPNREPVVNHWLHFLLNHRIEEFTLYFPNSRGTMLNHLFSFGELRHLCLVGCELSPPSTFKGFPRLVTLELDSVRVAPEKLSRFISRCPMLEHLTLYRYVCTSFLKLEIDAPNLKTFDLFFRGIFPLVLKSPTRLEDLTIACFNPIPVAFEHSQFNLIKFFGEISSVKNLKLSSWVIQWLAQGGVPEKLPNSLSHLIHLPIDISFVTMADVSCALCLIRSSPNLQSLGIRSINYPDIDATTSVVEFLKTQQECELSLSHLRNVKIKYFKGSEAEMEFVKLLLSAATALIKLELEIETCSTEKEAQMFKALARYPRASSKAEIII